MFLRRARDGRADAASEAARPKLGPTPGAGARPAGPAAELFRTLGRLAGLGLGLCAVFSCLSCTEAGQLRLARRILEDHRARTKLRPLAVAQVVRVRLTGAGAIGSETMEWDGENYRETISSAGLSTARGIQGGKGYFTDEDGVTRVASEPALSDLITRFYFWKRSYLFDDRADARLALGPADDATVSVRLTPRGGDPLLLTFARRDLSLVSAASRHLRLAFTGPTRFRDSTRRGSAVDAEILRVGLPTDSLQDRTVGGWSAQWGEPAARNRWTRMGRDVTIPASLEAIAVTLAIDGAADGPLRVRDSLADRLHLAFATDVFDRSVARGAALRIAGVTFPALAVQRSDALPEGIDAVAGGSLFREAVVEIDPVEGSLTFHDPARWVSAEGFFRVLLDDDGDRTVAIVRRKGENLRLLGPTAIGGPIALTPEARARLLPSGRAEVSGLSWGAALPDLPVLPTDGSEAEFGEDGRLGWDLVLRFHAFFDLPHRWAYLKAR